MKKLLSVLCAGVVLLTAFGGCSKGKSSSSSSASSMTVFEKLVSEYDGEESVSLVEDDEFSVCGVQLEFDKGNAADFSALDNRLNQRICYRAVRYFLMAGYRQKNSVIATAGSDLAAEISKGVGNSYGGQNVLTFGTTIAPDYIKPLTFTAPKQTDNHYEVSMKFPTAKDKVSSLTLWLEVQGNNILVTKFILNGAVSSSSNAA